MTKNIYLKEFQKRLPNGIVLRDETNFEFTEEEIISIFIWLKYFRDHFKEFGFAKLPPIAIPIVSRRLRMDFGVFNQPSTIPSEIGQYVVYLSSNGEVRKNTSLKEVCRILGL